jgi:hypothetical protein
MADANLARPFAQAHGSPECRNHSAPSGPDRVRGLLAVSPLVAAGAGRNEIVGLIVRPIFIYVVHVHCRPRHTDAAPMALERPFAVAVVEHDAMLGSGSVWLSYGSS